MGFDRNVYRFARRIEMLNRKESKSQMHIIIVGCGKVGSTLVEQLAKEGHSITIIDRDSAKIQAITNMYDAMGVVGNGASYNTQMEAGIEKADLFIAVTDSDELNLLCCTVAKREGKCVTIARVRTPEYSKEAAYLKEKLGLEMIINPEFETAQIMSRILTLPMAEDITTFAHGYVDMVKFKLPEGNQLDGKRIMDIGKDLTGNIVICAIERNGDVFIPSGQFILRGGDLISFVAGRSDLRKFIRAIGLKTGQVQNALIVGGGKATYYLGRSLIKQGIKVRVIEINHKKCEELSVLLPEAVIINDDGTNEEVLKEAGISDAQAFIPMTGIDEENILLSLHAKQVSEAKVITKVTRNNFRAIVSNMDLGSIIHPKYITSEAIIAYVRAKNNTKESNIETLSYMFDSKAEAIEFRVKNDSPVTGKSLAELKLKDNLLIAFIMRKGKIIYPSGSDMILKGDAVMIVTTHTGFHEIQDILA